MDQNYAQNLEFDQAPAIAEPIDLELIFLTKIASPVYTGRMITGEVGGTGRNEPINIMLINSNTRQRVTNGWAASLEVKIVLINAYFCGVNGDEDIWTPQEFKNNIVVNFQKKKNILLGDLSLVLKDGIGTLGEIRIKHDRHPLRNVIFRLGAMVDGDHFPYTIKEAITDPFLVKDCRNESKNKGPLLQNDKVWQLVNISKTGVIRKRLEAKQVKTVRNFLNMYDSKPQVLKEICGLKGKMWEMTLSHAKTSLVDDVEKDANSGVHGAEFAFGSSSTIKAPSNIHQFQHLKIRIKAIKSATNYFSEDNCIGRGGFGRVYKGELVHSTGKTMVAFKRLDSAVGQGYTEFWKEIMVLSFYKHENIVNLLGYCDDHGEKILVYEYLSKKSLDSYLASNDLTWAQRLKICIGAARGLAYLHTQTEIHLRIFHRDVKSSNILLDHNWNSKISDFGLSKFAPANNQFSFMVTNPAGSFWYIDPLYKDTGLLTKESDVYSFGVVLFEVLCGRLSFCESLRPLAGLAQEYYEQNKIDELIFSNIKDEIDMSSLKLFADVAYQCLKKNRDERPLMTQIVKVLEKALDIQRKFMTESFETESCM